MSAEEQLKLLVDRCTILYQGAPIPNSVILGDYLNYLNNTYKDRFCVALHTGSIFFDVLTVFHSILSPMLHAMVSNDSVIESLRPGDLFIMFKTKRCIFQSIEEIDGEKYITYIEEEAKLNGTGECKSRILYDKGKSQIRKYNGESKKLGGTGIRTKRTNRTDFLSWFLDVEDDDIPTTFDFSLLVLTDSKYFEEIIKNTTILYREGKTISLEDLDLPISYYTSNGTEKQFGSNQTKSQPNIIYTEKVSIIRDLIFDKPGCRILMLKGASDSEGDSELDEILRFDSVNNYLLSTPLQSKLSKFIIDSDFEAKFFACSKDYLEKHESDFLEKDSDIRAHKDYYSHLQKITRSHIEKHLLKGGIGAELYENLFKKILAIKDDTSEKEQFRMISFSLLNVFTSAFFTMSELESAISSGDIVTRAKSPSEKLSELNHLQETISDPNCDEITTRLEELYLQFFDNNNKKIALEEQLALNKDKKVLLLFPKRYYIDIFNYLYGTDSHVSCATIDNYDIKEPYDVIISVCGKEGKRFKLSSLIMAEKTIVLLYESECRLFDVTQKKASIFEKKLSAKISGQKQPDVLKIETTTLSKEEADYLDKTKKAEELLESLSAKNIFPRNYQYTPVAGGPSTIDVYSVGRFETGEYIFFTKFYKAVTYEQSSNSVSEKNIDELAPGDSLIFFKKNDYTRNVVDFIFELLLDEGRFSEEIIENYEKSRYWKEVLSSFKLEKHLTFIELEKRLKEAGLDITITAIQQWLADDSRIIGPRNITVFDAISKVTGDNNLREHRDEYFQSCRSTRAKRREIIGLISRAISDKYSGIIPDDNGPLRIIYDNIEQLSEILELDSIVKLEKPIKESINKVNRPIERDEG